jgi:hypothetical protein
MHSLFFELGEESGTLTALLLAVYTTRRSPKHGGVLAPPLAHVPELRYQMTHHQYQALVDRRWKEIMGEESVIKQDMKHVIWREIAEIFCPDNAGGQRLLESALSEAYDMGARDTTLAFQRENPFADPFYQRLAEQQRQWKQYQQPPQQQYTGTATVSPQSTPQLSPELQGLMDIAWGNTSIQYGIEKEQKTERSYNAGQTDAESLAECRVEERVLADHQPYLSWKEQLIRAFSTE